MSNYLVESIIDKQVKAQFIAQGAHFCNADEIAKLVVSNANAKEFIGKNEVKAKRSFAKTSNSSYDIKTNQGLHKKVEHKPVKQESKIVSNKADDTEWESF